MHPFLKVLILIQEFYKSKTKKNFAQQQNPPRGLDCEQGLSLPHPTQPSPQSWQQETLLTGQTFPSLPPSSPFPSPSHPFALYLSTYLPTPRYLPLYLSIYLCINLSIYLSTYPSA